MVRCIDDEVSQMLSIREYKTYIDDKKEEPKEQIVTRAQALLNDNRDITGIL